MLCLSINNRDFNKCRSLVSINQMVEIRGDLCCYTKEQYSELFRLGSVLFTYHCDDYAHYHDMLLFAIINGATMVDIDFSTPKASFNTLLQAARAREVKVVVSYHNYNETPSITLLTQLYNEMCDLGADVVKIVTTANSYIDGFELLKLYKIELKTPLIAFAMGEKGRLTRKKALALGAPFVFVAEDNNSITATGQYTIEDMENMLNNSSYSYVFDDKYTFSNREITIPCSKSVAQRAIVAAALSPDVSILNNYSPSKDSEAAIAIVRQLGGDVKIEPNRLIIKGWSSDKIVETVDVGESGLLARIMLPQLFYRAVKTSTAITVKGCGTLLNRDITTSISLLRQLGADVTAREGKHLPITISGSKISNEIITIDGGDGSQNITGMLMLMPLLCSDNKLLVQNTTSKPYIDLTLDILSRFGVIISCNNNSYSYKKGSNYISSEIFLDSDWSSASYFAVAGALTTGVTLKNMPIGSKQADEKILSVLKSAGVDIKIVDNDVFISPQATLLAFDVDLTNSPDLFPILSIFATQCVGKSYLGGVSRLHNKESDRLVAIYNMISSIGGEVEICGNNMIINGVSQLNGGFVDSYNDHRITMSAVIASLISNQSIAIDNIECVSKSFPKFFEILTNS